MNVPCFGAKQIYMTCHKMIWDYLQFEKIFFFKAEESKHMKSIQQRTFGTQYLPGTRRSLTMQI